MDVTSSDHKPLWIVPEIMECRLKKPFRFEQMWMSEKGCGDTIEAVWGEDVDLARAEKILKKVDKCRVKLTEWSKKNFGSVQLEIEKRRKQMVQAEKKAIRCGDARWLKKLEVEINTLLDKEAKMWSLRARVN